MWEAFWAQQMESLFDLEEATKGHDDGAAEFKAAYIGEASPRYPRPLDTEGRSAIPCLIHSDLWPRNIKPRTVTAELCVFDACASWDHYEGMSDPIIPA